MSIGAWKHDGAEARAVRYEDSRRYEYHVKPLPSGFWLAEMRMEDGSTFLVNASEMTRSGAMARCEMHASGYQPSEATR